MILAIDQGTTGTTCLVFGARGPDRRARLLGVRAALPPARGGSSTTPSKSGRSPGGSRRRRSRTPGSRAASSTRSGSPTSARRCVGWDPASGEPIHRALVWQDRRTAERCEELRAAGHEETVRARTGLVLDPYFSGTKIEWLLRNVEGAERRRLRHGRLLARLQAHRPPRDRPHQRLADDAVRHPPARLGRGALLAARASTPSACRSRCRPPRSSARRRSSAARCRWRESPGTSRRRSSARRASSAARAKNTYGTGSFVLLHAGAEAPAPTAGLLTTVAAGGRGGAGLRAGGLDLRHRRRHAVAARRARDHRAPRMSPRRWPPRWRATTASTSCRR